MKLDYQEKYEELSSGQKGSLKKHGENIIQYIQNTDTPYATSKRIKKEANLQTSTTEIGNTLGAIGEIYNQDIDYSSSPSTRGQWILHEIQDLPLQELTDEILEP